MARTNRKETPPAPAPSVDALDDLNLDDMFEGGDDSLFDGLDIDLDGMGDITGADNKKSNASTSKDLDDIKTSLLGPEILATATGSSSKRRKTKRKSKALPPALEEKDDDNNNDNKEEVVQPKKKRKIKGVHNNNNNNNNNNTNKKKAKRKEKERHMEEVPGAVPITKPKSKAKKGISTVMLPGGIVASSSHFGGRQKGRGPFTVPVGRFASPDRLKGKTKTVRSSASTQSTTTKNKARAPMPPRAEIHSESKCHQAAAAPINPNFCGLQKSDTLFYPFMPSLPPEPAMKRGNKLYPCIDKVYSTFVSSGNTPSAMLQLNGPNAAQENEPLFRLMVTDGENNHTTGADPNATKRATLAASIASARITISQTEKSQLVVDLQSLCSLVKRQFDFLSTSMENMEKWCRVHFNEADHASVYGPPPTSASSGRKQNLFTESIQESSTAGFTGFAGSTLKVKLKCNGFNGLKTASLLIAQLPLSPPSTTPTAKIATSPHSSPPKIKSESTKTAITKKRKVAPAVATELLSIPDTPEPVRFVPYTNLKPLQRRQCVVEAVSRKAHALETEYNEFADKRTLTLNRQSEALQKAVDDDQVEGNNTSGLWSWIEESSYFADFTEIDVKEIMHCAWQPELSEREMFWKDVPSLHIKRKKPKVDQEMNSIEQETSSASVKSTLFDKLQGLLVDEGSDDDEGASSAFGNERISPNDTTNSSLQEKSSRPSQENLHNCSNIIDLSDLSLDERTYIHLRAIGLVDIPFPPSLKPTLIEDEDASYESSEENVGTSTKVGEESDDKLGDIIRAMQDDLVRLHRLNNSRTALLESLATAHLTSIKSMNKKEEESVAYIAKYKLLVKKQKESKKNIRQKTNKKDEDWVPW